MATKPNTNPPAAPTLASPVSPSSPPASPSASPSASPPAESGITSAKSGTVVMQAILPPVAIIPGNVPASVAVASTMQVAAVADARVPTQVSALPMMPCPVCSVSTPVAKYCSDCGALMAQKKFCSDCGTSLKATAKFCDSCGAKVG